LSKYRDVKFQLLGEYDENAYKQQVNGLAARVLLISGVSVIPGLRCHRPMYRLAFLS
jgi:hypothetical protein